MVGPTQVGKSTLINAILGGYILPAGTGNVSVTGIATKVRNNGNSSFSITVTHITLADVVHDISNLLTVSKENLRENRFVTL